MKIKPKMIDQLPASKIDETENRKFMTSEHIAKMNEVSEVLKDTGALHVHSNKEIIDKFTEVNGSVKYDGKDLVGIIHTAADIKVVDQAGHFTSKDKTLENILAELFILANNAINGKD